MMHRPLEVTLVPFFLSLLAACSGTAGPRETGAIAEGSDPLKISEMITARDRLEVARLRTRVAGLLSELEGEAATGEAWAVIAVARVQMRADADGAWNRLREVVAVLGERGAQSYWAHLGMAEVYLIWELPDQAATELKSALSIFPGTAPALEVQGRIAMARKRPEEARAAFALAFEAGGPSGAPFAGLALSRLEEESDPAAARARADTILAAHPDLIEALRLSASLREPGPEKTALLERVLSLVPESGAIATELAASLEAEGKDAEALAAYLASARSHPADLEAWRAAARLARAAGAKESEAEALSKVGEIDPNEIPALVELAALRSEAGDLEGADVAWSEVLTRGADDGKAHLARGKVREAQERYRVAMQDYRDATTRSVDGAAEALEALAKRIGLPTKPVRGRSPDAVYGRVARLLGPAYEARLKETPELGGTLEIKVWVEEGKVVEASVVSDTLHDPLMEALAFWLVSDAGFPKGKGRKEFTLPFTFDPADYAP